MSISLVLIKLYNPLYVTPREAACTHRQRPLRNAPGHCARHVRYNQAAPAPNLVQARLRPLSTSSARSTSDLPGPSVTAIPTSQVMTSMPLLSRSAPGRLLRSRTPLPYVFASLPSAALGVSWRVVLVPNAIAQLQATLSSPKARNDQIGPTSTPVQPPP